MRLEEELVSNRLTGSSIIVCLRKYRRLFDLFVETLPRVCVCGFRSEGKPADRVSLLT